MRRLLAIAAIVVTLLVGAYFWYRGPGLEHEADRLATLLQLRPGMIVADIGAGDGRLAFSLAKMLAPAGRLYATELDSAKLDRLRAAASANMIVLAAGVHSTNLPAGCCDAIYLRRVYHHLSDAPAVNQSLRAALRPGGRLAIIDMLSPRWLFFFHHGMPADVIAGQIIGAGFTLDRRIQPWADFDYCLLFHNPAPPAPAP